MDDTPKSTGDGFSETGFVPPIIPVMMSERPAAFDFSALFKRCFSCNPFFLLSALLLLFGMYQISTGAAFSRREMTQLIFNLSSLEVYEFLMVVTAIFLSRRRLWFDSTLLASLENVFVIVPFILLSQVGLIRTTTLGLFCLSIGGFTMARFYGLKKGFPELNLPRRSLMIGGLFLAVNLTVTVTYRLLHEHKFGTKLNSGPAFYTNEALWLLIVPALCALMALAPLTSQGTFPHQRRAFPLTCALLWLAGSGAHFYCLGYIYDFDLHPSLWSPGLWVLAWVLYYRWPAIAGDHPVLRAALLSAPLVIPWFCLGQDWNGVFMALMLCNSVLFLGLFLRLKATVFYLHFAVGCALTALAVAPPSVQIFLHSPWPVEKLSVVMAGAYLLVFALRSRDARMGLLAAIIGGFATAFLIPSGSHAVHVGIQVALVLLLLHSLGWNDDSQAGARGLRFWAAGSWVLHAFTGISPGAVLHVSLAAAGIVMAVFFLGLFFNSLRRFLVVPGAAALVLLANPIKSLFVYFEQAPSGLLTVLASFSFFGLGTLAAITRPKWQKS